jgi:hypothetical protein
MENSYSEIVFYVVFTQEFSKAIISYEFVYAALQSDVFALPCAASELVTTCTLIGLLQ